MKKNITRRGFAFSPLGIGTWGIGGLATRNPENDDAGQIEAMTYVISQGVNFAETNMWSAEGHSAYLFTEAYKKSRIERDRMFINFSAYTYNAASLEELSGLFDKFLGMLGSDHVDAFTITTLCYTKYGKAETINFLKELLEQGKTRYVGLTNGNNEMLAEMLHEFGDKFFWHELGVNFEIRANEESGITEYDDQHDVLNVIFQPLRRNRTAAHNWPLLVELAEKYQKTQNQIILNWLHSKGYLILNKAETQAHFDENYASFDFEISAEDLQKMNDFRPLPWTTPKIDWYRTGDGTLATDGIFVDQLSNIFDDSYAKLTK